MKQLLSDLKEGDRVDSAFLVQEKNLSSFVSMTAASAVTNSFETRANNHGG